MEKRVYRIDSRKIRMVNIIGRKLAVFEVF